MTYNVVIPIIYVQFSKFIDKNWQNLGKLMRFASVAANLFPRLKFLLKIKIIKFPDFIRIK